MTSIVFRVLGDGKELWSSGEIGAYSDEVAADVDVSGVNRLALVADSLGGNVLGEEERKGYDVIMQKLFETDISDSSKTSLTVNLQENGIYLLRSEVNRIKEYLADDEPRFYFIYYWNEVAETRDHGQFGSGRRRLG